MKRKLFSFNSLFLIGTLIFVLSLIPNRSEAQTLTTVFSDNFESYTVGTAATALGYKNTYSAGGTSQVIASGTGANSSTKYVNMTGSATGNYNCYFIKSVNVIAGQTYIYSVYTQAPAGKGYSVSYSSTALGNHSISLTNTTWAKQSFTFKATVGEAVDFTVYMWSTGTVYVDDILLQREQWNIAASANNGTYGSVSGTTGLTDPGTTVSLTATPSSGYYFVNWTENGTQVSATSTYSFTSSADRNLVANFAPIAVSLTLTGTLSPFSSTYGSVSAEQNFSVAGSTLTSDIVVTPPTGFEVSLTSGSGFGSSVTLPQLSGSVATTPVYVRMKVLAAGTYSAANITINTTGGGQTLSCSGTVAQKALTIAATGPSKTYGTALAAGTSATNFTHSGEISGETVTSVTLTPDAAGLSATTAAGAGYVVTPSLPTGTGGFLASNYNISYTAYNGTVAIANPTLAFATPTSVSKIIGDAVFSNAATSSIAVSGISYSSGNTAVATVDASTGSVTIVSAGSAVITASFAATGNYFGSSSAYTLNVYNSAIFRDNFDSYATSTDLGTVSVPTYGGAYSIWNSSATTTGLTGYLNTHSALLNGAANKSLYMRKTINVTAGHTYIFSALTWSGSTLNSLNYEFNTSKVSGSSGSPTVINKWIPQSVTFTAATSEPVDIFIYSWVTAIYSDDWLVVDTTPTVTPTVGTYTYNGNPQGPNAATNTGTGSSYTYSYVGVSPTVYTASSTQPTAAGTYTVTATVAANGNYTQGSSSATAFTIDKATPTITVTVGKYTYNASPQGPNAATTGGSTGAVTYSYVGTGTTIYAASATQPTEVGTYTVTASVAPDANYNAASSSATPFTIDVSTAVNTISLSNIQILTNNKKLHINAPSLISSVSVYDAFGRLMARQIAKNTSVSIDMQSSGIYIVETKLENGELSRNKFIIR